MAETRRPLTTDPSVTPPQADPEIERLHEDIAHSREQIAENLGELRERLSPSRVLHDAADRVKGAAADAGEKVAARASETATRVADRAQSGARAATRQVQSHPLGSGALLAGAAWWLVARRRRQRGHPLTAAHVGPPDRSGWMWPALAAATLLAASQSQSVRSRIDGDRVAAAGRTMRDAATSLGRRARQARTTVADGTAAAAPALPLLAGLATLIAGLAIGLADSGRDASIEAVSEVLPE